jgi:hypothetical protein
MNRRAEAVALVAALGGCSPTEGPLTDPALWSLVPSGDMFPDHAAAYTGCSFADAGSFYEEGGQLEVETGSCGYMTLEQPSLRAVPNGSSVAWVVAHADLIFAESAEAHVAISIADEVLWDFPVRIPFPSEVFALEATATSRAPLGAPVRIHLHNHGQNTWTFSEGQVAP